MFDCVTCVEKREIEPQIHKISNVNVIIRGGGYLLYDHWGCVRLVRSMIINIVEYDFKEGQIKVISLKFSLSLTSWFDSFWKLSSIWRNKIYWAAYDPLKD